MVKISVYIGASLDGFIARENGDIGWLDEANKNVTPGEDFGFNNFIESVDLIVMGRKTFQQVKVFDNWPYRDKRLIVLTTKNLQIPEKLGRSTTTFSTFVPEKLISELSDQHVDHIYLDGGLMIQEFLSAGLVDEVTVTIVPIIIGSGKSFSKLVSKDLHLNRLKTTVYEFGFIQIKYRITNLKEG